MNVALAKTGTERAPSDIFAVARDRLPGTGRIAEAGGRRSRLTSAPAFRTGGSRNGNTPIYAY